MTTGPAVARHAPEAADGRIGAPPHRKRAQAGLVGEAQGVAAGGQQLGLHAQQVLAGGVGAIAEVKGSGVGAGQRRRGPAGAHLKRIHEHAGRGAGG